jgi:hypothetical protein
LLAVDWWDVHGHGQCRYPNARLLLHNAQRPDLCAADAGQLLDLLEMGFYCVEHHAKAAQDLLFRASRRHGRRHR